MRALLLRVFAAALLAAPAAAQAPLPAAPASGTAIAWQLVIDGRAAARALPDAPADSLEALAAAMLADLRAEGYLLARLDSAVVDRTEGRALGGRLYLARGPLVRVGQVRLAGMRGLDSLDVLARLDTRPGRPYRAEVLRADLGRILARYDRAGYGLAEIHVGAALHEGEVPTLDLTLTVAEGRPLRFGALELVGARHRSPSFATPLLGLRAGRPLAGFDPEAIRQRLDETGFYRRVGVPELIVRPDSLVVVRVEVQAAPPGAFDLVFGYLPSQAPEGGGSLVGNGQLVLRNLFGGGRVAALRLDQRPGQVSSAEVEVRDPFVAGLPVGIEGRFVGLQQDSTYAKQQYGLEVAYRLPGGLEAFVTYTREATRPGPRGTRLVGGRQRIPRADARFTGLGVRFRRVDDRINPRRGLFVETNLERGRKVRSARVDTTRERSRLVQERLEATARVYLPTFRRQGLVVGADVRALASDPYDLDDLFRLGGATTLRGYNEDQFEGRLVGRALAEYRYQLDQTSFAFVFFDLGYLDRPAVGEVQARRQFYPGYGAGVRFATGLGLVTTTYAVNGEDGLTAGRVHVGLSFGL